MPATLASNPKTTWPQPATAATTDWLALRFLGPDRHGDVVRVSGVKCTIGSSSSCDIRLTSRGVRAVHCTIVRGPRGAVVRRWTDETRLNGREFTDAPLRAGDRLQCGPVELEVLGQTRTNTSTPRTDKDLPISLTLSKATVTTPSVDLDCLSGSSKFSETKPLAAEPIREETSTINPQAAQRLLEARQMMRRRTRRILSQLRAVRAEKERLERDQQQHIELRQTMETRIAELEGLLVDYRSRTENAERNQLTLEQEREALLQQIEGAANTESELRKLLADNEAATAKVSEQAESLTAQLEEKIQHLTDSENYCAELQQQIQQFEASIAVLEKHLIAQANAFQELSDNDGVVVGEQHQANGVVPSHFAAELAAKENENQTLLRELQSLYVEVVALRQQHAEVEQATLLAHSPNEFTPVEHNSLAANDVGDSLSHEPIPTPANITAEPETEGSPKSCELSSTTSEEYAESYAENAALFGFPPSLHDHISADNDPAWVEQGEELSSKVASIDPAVPLTNENDPSTEIAAEQNDTEPANALTSVGDDDVVATEIAAEEPASEVVASDEEPSTTSDSDSTSPSQENVSDVFARLQLAGIWKQEMGEDRVEEVAKTDEGDSTDELPSLGPDDEVADEVAEDATDENNPRSASAEAFASSVGETFDQLETTAPSTDSVRHEEQCVAEEQNVEEEPQADDDREDEVPTTSEFARAAEEESTESPEEEPDVEVEPETPKTKDTSSQELLESWKQRLFAEEEAEAKKGVGGTHASPTMAGKPTGTAASLSMAHASQSSPPTGHQAGRKDQKDHQDDEDSVEEYMARLLQRMRGSSGGESKPVEKPKPVAPQPEAAKTPVTGGPVFSEAAMLQTTLAADEEASPKPAKPYTPRVAPKDLAAKLATMREIANSSTRAAIETHQIRTHQESAKMKLAMAFAAVCVALAILFFSWRSPRMWQFAGVLGSLGLSVYWTMQAFGQRVRAISRAKKIKTQ